MKDLERNNIIFGAAYYPEYMPYERLQEDIAMMQEAGMILSVLPSRHGALWNRSRGNSIFLMLTKFLQR